MRAKGRGRGRGNYLSVMENINNVVVLGIVLFVIFDILKIKIDRKGLMKINCMYIYVLIMLVFFSMKYNWNG